MDNKSFWLANISGDSLTVSYVSSNSGRFKVSSIGPEVLYQSTPDSFVAAIDQSLSESASSINLPEHEEPNSIALIISPFWVGSDGKILNDKLKLFESLFKELKLNPMGFIGYDEAILEEANISDGFPSSFIIVNIEPTSMIVSLTYLGKVIERITKKFPDVFDPSILESSLLEFKTDSTLPPQIILLGEVTEEILEKVKNYPWIGKKNVETFLHFPEIKNYSNLELNTIYTKAITSQFEPPENTSVAIEEESSVDEEVVAIESDLSEVAADDLGFTEGDNFTIPDEIPEQITEIISEPPKKSPKFVFPKFKLPQFKFRLPQKNILIYPLMFSPLLVLIPFYFASAKITLYVTPLTFTKSISITLDPSAKSIDLKNKILPVSLKTTDSNASVSLATTGKKTIGQKAQGEITIFNKQDKVQSLPKGSVLTDGAGRKFELLNQVQVAASSSDLTLGVINLGKTKAMVIASDIGSEFNLSKDVSLNFKDFGSSIMIAKVNESISGGSKSEVRAVSATDKVNIETKLNSQISTAGTDNVSQELTRVVKKGRIEFNREIGEESDELTATIQTTTYIFYFNSQQKLNALNAILIDESGFKDAVINPDKFSAKINPTTSTTTQVSGQLSINGTSTPNINPAVISRLVAGKFISSASTSIKNYPRVYKYDITPNIPVIPLPFRLSNISVDVK